MLDEIDAAWSALVDDGRVLPGDAACSLLITRLEADDPAAAMPPGSPLSEAERCAVRQWVDDGAPR